MLRIELGKFNLNFLTIVILNLPKYISKKILNTHSKNKSTSKPVVNIAITGIALGVMAMLLSVMIVTGFRNEITNKITGFMADIRLSKFDSNNSFEEQPLTIQKSLIDSITHIKGVERVQSYAYKACILKATDDIQGVVLKGADGDFNWSFFKDKLVDGVLPNFNDSINNEVLLSSSIAKKLKLKTGNSFLVFFIQKDRKVRKLKISGLYNSGLSDDFDKLYVICNMNLIRQVNNWKVNEVGGYEIFANRFSLLDQVSDNVYKAAGIEFNTQTIRELYPQMFNWLDLQNLNVIVIITLISLIASVTMISTLLILILENSKQIGLLKSLGANDQLIAKTFMNVALNIILKGMFIGNFIAIGFALLQTKYGLISLSEESYYLSKVPVNITFSGIIMINLGTLLICTLILFIPLKVISKIQAIKVLHFE